MERNPQEIAALFSELADRVAFAGESPFKVRAYREAGHRIAMGELDLSRPGELERTHGIGEKIAAKIRLLLRGEDLPSLVRLRAEQPQELSALLRLPGVGPSTARRLWAAGIGSVAQLQASMDGGMVPAAVTKGQREQILRAFAERRLGVPLPDLLAATAALRTQIYGIEPAGGLRLLDPTVQSPRWIAPASARNRSAWASLEPWTLPGGFTLQEESVQFVEERVFGALLLLQTGPASFALEMGQVLAGRGLQLHAQGGLTRGEEVVACPTEEEVFALAGTAPVPPPLRGLSPIDRERAPRAVLGDLHTHSNWSDGGSDIRAMAMAALARGYRYLAVTDHSQGLKVARGLTPERYRAQRLEIEALRRELPQGFTLLQGCEVDIHPDGSLDLPDDLLAELDVVIASVHGQFEQGREEATARLVRAMHHPLVTALGHPGARKLGLRPPLAADWPSVFAAAAGTGTALELNASPRRLDLDYRWLREAGAGPGLSFLIDTDAHAPEELDHMPLGIAQAQKAGLSAEQIRNAGPVEGVLRRKNGRG